MSRFGSATHQRLLLVVAVILVATIAGMVALWPAADQLLDDDAPALEDLVDGEVVAVQLIEGEPDPIAGLSGELAQIQVRAIDGPDAGELLDFEVNTDGFPTIEVGDRVALDRTTGPDGDVQYFITDFQRLPTLVWLVGLFVLAVLAISRWHGLRSLIGLGISLLIIVRFIVPAILAGNSPPVVALVGAVAVMIVTLYLTHGVNEMTTAAVIGTSAALSLTVVLGLFFVDAGRITGFASDDAVFARFQIDGLDLQGLVLAGLIIAALGVLDDVTISQSSTVFAIHDTDRRLGWAALFARAMRVGRDHIASVVNTLFLAYAGASIALLLLFSTSGLGLREILNSEQMAEEIIKTVVGSLGLIAAVPLTTALAASVAIGRSPDAPAVHGHDHGGSATRAASAAADDHATGETRSAGPVGRRARGTHRAQPAGSQPAGSTPTASQAAGSAGAPQSDPEERERQAWEAYLKRYGAAHPDVAAAGDASEGDREDGSPGTGETGGPSADTPGDDGPDPGHSPPRPGPR